jgi:hypothetical protein
MLSIMIRKLSFFIRFYNSCKKFFVWQCIFALFLLSPLIHCASNYKKEYAPSAGDNKSIPQGMNADKKATENGKEKKNDPDLAIDWGDGEKIISDKDTELSTWKEMKEFLGAK